MATAELVSIGTELLLGQILNTNAQFLSRELAEIGIDCFWHTTVGDNPDRIMEAMRTALQRCRVVLTSGGLGPTADDLTHESIGQLLNVELKFDEAVMKHIEDLFQRRGFLMVESNRKQALRPQGADLLPNPVGTAPGIVWRLSPDVLQRAGVRTSEERYILTFPGVPQEMKAMWSTTARPFLQEQFAAGAIFSCELKHFGIGESALAEKVSDLLELSNPTVAPLAGQGECRLRVTGKAKTPEEAQGLVEPIVSQIKGRTGKLCYGFDDDTLESVVGDLLSQRGMRIAVAESCTGGLVSKRLTDIAGSSAYIELNLVTYADRAKKDVLGVHEYILQQKGAVSAECAHAMATGARKLAGADIGLSITGIAGPGGGTPEKPVGLVYLALVGEHTQQDKRLSFAPELSRSEIRHRTANEALNMVRLYLLEQ